MNNSQTQSSWNTDSRHQTFESANDRKLAILKEGNSIAVKIRRMSNETFVVKKRNTGSADLSGKTGQAGQPEKTKNRAARRNAKNKRNKK